VIQTSQGGINATIGINSQMFNQGDSAYFTFVKNPDPNFTGTNLDPNEADDADNLLYGDNNNATNDLLETNVAFLQISQIQSGVIAGMSITAYNLADSPKGRTLLDDSGENPVAVTRVIVYAADHETVLDDSTWAEGVNSAISFAFSGGVATVTGINAGNWIEWTTSALHDQVKITGTGGKFDVGGFGLNEPSATSVPLEGVRFEDDGPTADLDLALGAAILIDESLGENAGEDESSSLGSLTVAGAVLFDDDSVFGTDGAKAADSAVYSLSLSAEGADSGLDETTSLENVLLYTDGDDIVGKTAIGGDEVFRIEIDPTSGDVTVTLLLPLVNPDDGDDDEAGAPLSIAAGLVSAVLTVTDADDDTDADSVDIGPSIQFEDDGPTSSPGLEDGNELFTDDTDIEDTASRTTIELFPTEPDYGQDGPNDDTPKVYSLVLSAENALTDLVDTETDRPIRLVTVGDDIVGYVDLDGSTVIEPEEQIAELEAIRYTIVAISGEDVEKQVDFIQSRAVYHDDDPLPETVGDGLVSITQVAIDGDGDPTDAESVDLGAITFISDAEPEIGPVANSVVDFAAGDSSNEELNGVVGKDPNASPYTLTYFTPTITTGGVELHGVLSDGDSVVTYYADDDGEAGYGTAGDTAYYKLELGDQGGEGDYTFTVLVDPPPSFTEFTFEDLPSGSNLFGIVGEGNAGLVVFGRDIGLKADNTYISNQTQEIKTSQAGPNVTIGIESQMFDPGDAAYFTFVNNPDPNVTGLNLGSTEADDADNIDYGSTIEGDSAFVRIAQLQGNADPSMSIEVFNIAGAPQGPAMIATRGDNEALKDPDVIAVRVYDADGNLLEDTDNLAQFNDPDIEVIITDGVATVTGFSDDYLIAWDADEDFDQTLISGVAGKFDIGGFGFFQGNDTPDQQLDFTARVTDGDGDYDEASWSVGIDGTGVFDNDSVVFI